MEEGDLILCTVEKVTNTITIVRLPDGKEGTIVSSEIAPGRIKHMRHHVIPNKKIVCKVLEISGNHIHLSLRRVNSKEKKEVMQIYKQKQAIEVAFKQIFGEEIQEIKKKILEDFGSLIEFIDKTKENGKLITKYIPKEKQNAIRKISDKKTKSSELKQHIKIKCLEKDGLKKIKEIFNFEDQNVKVTYISAGDFKLKLKVKDFKQGKRQMVEIIDEMEKRAKINNCEFFAKEER